MINKKNYLFLLLLSIIFLFSCKDKKVTTGENKIKFSQIVVDTIAHLENDSTKPSCSLKMTLKYPVEAESSTQLDSLQRIFIETSLGLQYINKSFKDAANAYAKSYVEDYLKLSKEFDSDDYMNSFSFNYEESVLSKIYFNEDGFLNYSLDVFSYTGGAHGMGGTFCYVIYLKNTNLITLEEIFPYSSLSSIGEMIVAQLIKDRELKTTGQLTEDGFFSVEEIMPTDNFYFNKEGMTWIYNPYQIAVFSLGEIRVSLKWENLKDLINEESPLKAFVDNI